MERYILEFRLALDAFEVSPVVFDGLRTFPLSSLNYSCQELLVILPIGSVAHFFPVDCHSSGPILDPSLPLFLQTLESRRVQQVKFLTFFFNFIFFYFLFLFGRLVNLPQIVHFEGGKTLKIKFSMAYIGHMLLGTVFAAEFVFAIDAFTRVNYVFDVSYEAKQVCAFIFKWRETVRMS